MKSLFSISLVEEYELIRIIDSISMSQELGASEFPKRLVISKMLDKGCLGCFKVYREAACRQKKHGKLEPGTASRVARVVYASNMHLECILVVMAFSHVFIRCHHPLCTPLFFRWGNLGSCDF